MLPFCFAIMRLLLAAAVSLMVITSSEAATAGDAYSYKPSMCQKSFTCGEHFIHYPFYLSNESQVMDGVAYSYCGYPGMAILCDNRTTGTLQLAGGTNYTVLGIDYDNHKISLADADALKGSRDDCPRLRHNVTIPPEAWLGFAATGNSSISFFLGCNFTAAPPPPELIPINCTGFDFERGSFLGPQLGVPDGDWSRACEEVYVVPVLSEWLASPDYSQRLGSGGYGEVLRRGFQLSWDPSAGPCFKCELSEGQCSYNHLSEFMGCLCSDGSMRVPDCGPKKTRKKICTKYLSAL